MASTSGIRATGSDHEYSRKPLLKNAAGYGAWSTKMSTILEGEECWELVQGIELEPRSLGVQVVGDGDGVDDPADQVDIARRTERVAEIKDWKRRFTKAASQISQAIDDTMVHMLDIHNKNAIRLMYAFVYSSSNSPLVCALLHNLCYAPST